MLVRLAARRAGVMEARAVREVALRPLCGLTRKEVAEIGRRVFEQRLRAQVRCDARAEIRRVRAEGFVPVLATGAFEFLAWRVAEEVGVGEVVCTRLAFEGERCAGRIQGEETRQEVKAAAVREHFAKLDVDWAGSRAYSDDVEDVPLWNLVRDRVLVRGRGGRRMNQPGDVRIVEWADT